MAAQSAVGDGASKRAAPFDPALGLSDRLFRRGYDSGIVFRAFADGTIGLAPALWCTEAEMELLLARLRKTLDSVLEDRDVRAALR